MNELQTLPTKRSLKTTVGRCLVCHKPCPAEVFAVEGELAEHVVLERTCPEHGHQSVIIANDSRFYWVAKGRPENSRSGGGGCGCSGGSCSSVGLGGGPAYFGFNASNPEPIETFQKLSTCVALIELVQSCNLPCPTCFAAAPLGATPGRIECTPFDQLVERVEGVLAVKGKIEMLQLSGGEPTLHPEFCRFVEWARRHKDIEYVVINTNGIRFANDAAFLEQMGKLQAEYDNIQLYLQFDGTGLHGQHELRGADLRDVRQRAIENCATIKLPITLAMTVIDQNLDQLWETSLFGLQYPHVRGLSFQPRFRSGRIPDPTLRAMPQPISMGDIVIGLCDQSRGQITFGDITPLPCGDPNCAMIGWLIRTEKGLFSPAILGIDVPKLQASLPNKVVYRIEDLIQCGCDNTALGDAMKYLEMTHSTEFNAFRFTIKPFMDARTWDDDRIDRCCTHVIRPDGKLDSFCRYYSGFPDTWNAPKAGTH